MTAMVEDIEAANAELIRKGVPIVQSLRELPGGVAKVVCFADPDGNWLEFAQRLR